jgi:hypothetical protein
MNRVAVPLLPLLMAALAASPARGQDPEPLVDEPPFTTPLRPGPGFALEAGAGITSMVQEVSRSAVRAGVTWDLRAAIGTRRSIGAEIAYVGSAQPLAAPGPGLLVGHGVEAAFRFNVHSLTRGGLLVEPFCFLGAGSRWFELARGADGRMEASRFRVTTLPTGLGLALGKGAFFLDGRLTYRPVVLGDVLFPIEDGAASLQSWSFGLLGGHEF